MNTAGYRIVFHLASFAPSVFNHLFSFLPYSFTFSSFFSFPLWIIFDRLTSTDNSHPSAGRIFKNIHSWDPVEKRFGGLHLGDGGVSLHEALAFAVDEVASLSTAALRHKAARPVDPCRVELHELHVLGGSNQCRQHEAACRIFPLHLLFFDTENFLRSLTALYLEINAISVYSKILQYFMKRNILRYTHCSDVTDNFLVHVNINNFINRKLFQINFDIRNNLQLTNIMRSLS